MKNYLKISLLVSALGIFAASCGGNGTATAKDSVTTSASDSVSATVDPASDTINVAALDSIASVDTISAEEAAADAIK